MNEDLVPSYMLLKDFLPITGIRHLTQLVCFCCSESPIADSKPMVQSPCDLDPEPQKNQGQLTIKYTAKYTPALADVPQRQFHSQ